MEVVFDGCIILPGGKNLILCLLNSVQIIASSDHIRNKIMLFCKSIIVLSSI